MSDNLLRAVLVAAMALCLVAGAAGGARAEEYGRLFVLVKAVDRSLVDQVGMVSAVTPDGRVAYQQERLLVAPPNVVSFPLEELAPGIWDVRFEGAGLVTEVKKGVHVFAGRDGHLELVARPGTGVHIVEYAVAGLSREEVAARLAALEGSLARLRAEMEALRPAAAQTGGG